MMPDAVMGAIGGRVLVIGSVDWLDMWVGHARPGACQMIGPVSATHLINDGVGKRVQALDERGLIVAVWKRGEPHDFEARWEWQLVRTGRNLPGSWPLLTAPKPAAAPAVRKVTAIELVFEMIKDAALAGRPAPSNEQILQRTDVTSLSSASSLIANLQNKGLIKVDGAGKQRVISVIGLGVATARVPA